jgi:hypothetical protein
VKCKTFSLERKLRQFITRRLAVKEWLKEVLKQKTTEGNLEYQE